MATTPKAPTAAKTKAKALSLHIGLNLVNPKHYAGWDGQLTACEFDAHDMAALAKAQGMKPTVLLTKQATRAKVMGAVSAAAKALVNGDLFVLTFSGHGGQVPDVDGDEPDHRDETWCLWDGQVIDDEMYAALSHFAAGVRILVLSDACHSGSAVRTGPPAHGGARSREMPRPVAERVYRDNKAFYDQLQHGLGRGRVIDPDAALANVNPSPRLGILAKTFKASVVLISGCQDNQTSADGDHNGLFTEHLLATWRNGAFSGNYSQFHARIRARMPADQTPNLFTLGPVARFLAQKPFQV